MVANDLILELLELTITMHRHAVSREWELLTAVEKQRTRLLNDTIEQNSIMTEDRASIQKIRDLQLEIVNLAIAERERLTTEYQNSRARIDASNYYLNDGLTDRPNKPPQSGRRVDKEVI